MLDRGGSLLGLDEHGGGIATGAAMLGGQFWVHMLPDHKSTVVYVLIFLFMTFLQRPLVPPGVVVGS